MEVITIDSSDDDSDCSEADEGSGKARKVVPPTIGISVSSSSSLSTTTPLTASNNNKFQSHDDDDSDSSSADSSDDSIWNVKGILSSLNVADVDVIHKVGHEDFSQCGNKNSLCIIFSPSSTDEKRKQSIAQSEDDDGSISSDDSIWNKTGLVSRKKTIMDRGESRMPPLLPRRNGSANDIINNNGVENITSTASKRDTFRSTSNDEHEESAMAGNQLHVNGTWRIVLLMDHREFGCANNFLQTVETNINNHFGAKHAEITTLPSADYMFVARLISNTTGEVLDERVLDLVIERKNVQDVCNCLITDSKKYKPLSFFEAQMYKLQHCGMTNKLFLMEGDEDKTRNFFAGAKSEMEKAKRLKRVKTIRKQIENGEFKGVDLICTRNRMDTIKFLIHQLERFVASFDPTRPPTKTMEQLKVHINEQMKNPTFLEYLRLRKEPGIGDVKAMKVIMDPTLDWNKNFVSPSSKKKTKATLTDRAIFWNAKYRAANDCSNLISFNILPGEVEQTSSSTPLASKRTETEHTDTVSSVCVICCQSIDIWTDVGIISCNRIAACGATFHQKCLEMKKYDIRARDGCLKCNAFRRIDSVKENCDGCDEIQQHGNVTRKELNSGNNYATIVVLDSEDDEDETDIIVVLD